MNVSVKLSSEETELIKTYADMHGVTVSEFMKQSVLERIKDEIDIGIYNEGMEEYKRYPVSYSLEEFEKELDL